MGLLHWPLVSGRSLFCSSSGCGYRTPIADRDFVFLGLLGLMLLIPYVSELVGTNAIMALIYILSGAAK